MRHVQRSLVALVTRHLSLVTDLRGPTAGIWYHLYVILDIFSRKIVGWRAETREDARLAEELVTGAYVREGVEPHQLTLHADRGAAMTSKTLADLLGDLGVAKSHSRPTISDDNPYSESQFKTMKYGPTYPDRFASLDEARAWMRTFVAWYNHHHRHSGIAFLTLDVVHQGQAQAVLAQRQATLDAAYACHPERYPRGRPEAGMLPAQVGINLPRPSRAEASTPATTPAVAAPAPPCDGVGADQTALVAPTSPTGVDVAPPIPNGTTAHVAHVPS
jgi:putative transposase